MDSHDKRPRPLCDCDWGGERRCLRHQPTHNRAALYRQTRETAERWYFNGWITPADYDVYLEEWDRRRQA